MVSLDQFFHKIFGSLLFLMTFLDQFCNAKFYSCLLLVPFICITFQTNDWTDRMIVCNIFKVCGCYPYMICLIGDFQHVQLFSYKKKIKIKLNKTKAQHFKYSFPPLASLSQTIIFKKIAISATDLSSLSQTMTFKTIAFFLSRRYYL